MKISIKNAIYLAITKKKWIDIKYKNASNFITHYYIGIKDIDLDKEQIFCDIFNPYKMDKKINDPDNIFIYISNIIECKVIEQSYYETSINLQNKINSDKRLYNFFDLIKFDNNILNYLSECYKFDNDPYIKDYVAINDIDIERLLSEKNYHLDDEQFNTLLEKVFKKSQSDAERINRYVTLAINNFSIDSNGHPYVVAYNVLTLNFKTKTLIIDSNILINKSFIISEDKKINLSKYIDIDSQLFCETFSTNRYEYINKIKDNLFNGEIINTRPFIFLLERDSLSGIDETFESIHELDINGKLTQPLKAFFGRNRCRNNINKGCNIVIFDKNKINIDQLRVVYNAMTNHITYVKGPPGTGKTETIFNVILSAYANEKTVLICSNNNHPIDDIYTKISNSFNFKNYFGNNEKIYFPIIRLGNNNEMKNTIVRLKEIYNFAFKLKNVNVNDSLTNKSKDQTLMTFNLLKNQIENYEEQVEIKEKIECLNKIKKFTKIERIVDKLEEEIKQYNNEIDNLDVLKDEEIMDFAISANTNKSFQDYIKYSSLSRYFKLFKPSYKQLREIILIDDIEKSSIELTKFLKNDLNLKRFLSIFPNVVCTNLSCDKLGSPTSQFDLVIMDESGQCNIASSLIPIVRGDNLLLVGDTNQLQPVTVIEEHLHDTLKNNYSIKDEYNYGKNSIMSTMLKVDNNSKTILLTYHYRCGKKIANFVNQRFYDNKLKLFNSNDGELIYYDVQNKQSSEYRNACDEEAQMIAKIIKENKYNDVAVITPFVNQANLINKYLKEFKIDNVKAGTIHTLQGSEKNTIIMSPCISLKTAKKTMDWIKNNHEIINVGITRAKERFIFVGDKTAIDTLNKDESTDIKNLSDYVFKNGEMNVPKSDTIMSIDFSNNSKNEKEFFETIEPYFNRRNSKFRIQRNVPLRDAINAFDEEEIKLFGKKEFDVIVQARAGLFTRKYNTIVVFELDGGEHIGSKRTSQLDRQKENICQKHGIKLIRIPNSAIKDYESIINLFEFSVKNIRNMNEYTQISLFEES